MEKVDVAVHAPDPLTHAGLVSHLRTRSGITVLPAEERSRADVLIVAAERLTTDVIAMLRLAAGEVGAPVVLVAGEISEQELLIAVECRVVAILPRAVVTAERLLHSVLAAASGGGVLPPNLVGELLKHVERLQRDVLTPNGLNASGLTAREIDVLRLMADGLDTNEIADELCYSERTVKNVIYGLNHRLKLRNRSHAVAYAVRSGVI
ncbi:helix-turn-helix transcriptional regulator [Actinoplanes philippinensis]|uniref:DNA-binding response regulator, NarL/FixJ family, contains REC and HTH domains n=1 Tax=Actinoplanes philippinensis TaxID=35752 RepID=A0A1I2HLR0_9ACTN|nr:response regulator transcription factor [Actinoplanes philippinensis]GIE82942.1 helix-turn-helix transcriptional regulator [Actinoplanes philippinensis]SFF29331.1 DNA-binding response regulator, NarL/FixJ family, contains REC and HTH domains [Actinoplanes philippinensis]